VTTESATPTLSQRLAAYIHGARLKDIDEAAIARAKHVIVYHVGLALRGIRASDPDSMQAIGVARELSEGLGSSTIIGTPYKATLVDAAFANCTLMRSFALDDVIFPAGIHPGLVTLPVALSIAERSRPSGAEVLTGIILAYEVLGKFGRWMWSAETPRRATMPFGTFGAVVAAARVLGLTQEQTTNVLGYAAHTAMGLAEGDAGPISHYYSMVCRNGVTGAYLAKSGGWASSTVLEGKFGFLESFLGTTRVDMDGLIDSLGHDYVILSSCEKRYPGTALNQVPIELMRALAQEQALKASDIDTVHLELPIERRNFAAGHAIGPFPDRTSASSSVAFQLAILLLDGELRDSRYEEYSSAEIFAITRRFTCEHVQGKPIRYAKLDVRTRSGQRFIREGEDFLFPPENARTIMERDAAGVLPPRQIARFLSLLESLEHLDDASQLIQCLVP
jgi:2-methylcitrate dehydratase PrpD